MGRLALLAVVLGACKAELADSSAGIDSGTSQPDTAVTVDGAIDATVLGAWSMPTAIPGASSDAQEDDGTLSSNKLELYFKRSDAGDNNLYVMTRASVTSPWGAPDPLTTLNSTATEESPRLSPDDLTMHFGRGGNIYRTTRTAIGQNWTAPIEVTVLNTGGYEKWADVCDNGYVIVSRDIGNGDGQDLYDGDITTGAPNEITAFNTGEAEQGTLLTPDCLRVYFQSNRDGQFNIYEASRTTTTTAWQNPSAMTDFNTTTFSEEDPWISTDQRVFVYVSNANGNKDLFISTR